MVRAISLPRHARKGQGVEENEVVHRRSGMRRIGSDARATDTRLVGEVVVTMEF